MSHRFMSFCAAVVIASTAGFSASAAPLEADILPKDAKWVIHLDYEALTDSAIAERVRSKRPELVDRVHKWFEEKCGADPRKDIHSVTIFSENYQPHSGAVIIRGDFDETRVRSLLMEKRDVQQTEHDGNTYYTWKLPRGHEGFNGEHVTGDEAPVSSSKDESPSTTTDTATDGHADDSDDGVSEASSDSHPSGHTESTEDNSKSAEHHGHQHEVTAVLIEGKKAVLAGSLERAKQVVSLLNGDEPTLKDDSKLLADMPENALVYGAAIDLKELSQHSRPFPILSQHRRVQWYVGERDDQMFETLVLVADRSKTAREMEKAMEGLMAFAKLWAGDLETLSELYDDTEIDRDGSTVTVEWEGDVENVMAALDELQPRFQAWKEYHKMRR